MKFDPNKKENLTDEMRIAISQVLQYGLLDQVFSKARWADRDIVFHGGTSIHVAWASPRRSEDIDFMVAENRARSVTKLVADATVALQRDISRRLPGSVLQAREQNSNDENQKNVLRHRVTWTHPAKNGSVKVVLEFFKTPTAQLQNYQATSVVQAPHSVTAASRPELMEFELSDMTAKASLNVARPESILGDKLVAICMRPYTKARDYFDLWWLRTQLGIDISGQDLYETVLRSADIYGYGNDELLAGIERVRLRQTEIRSEMRTGIEKFLPPAIAAEIENTDGYDAMFKLAMSQLSLVESVLRENTPPTAVLAA